MSGAEDRGSRFPEFVVDTMYGYPPCRCLPSCEFHQDELRTKLLGRYVGQGGVTAEQLLVAHLSVNRSPAAYADAVRQVNGAEIDYEVRKSTRRGYLAHPFRYEAFLPDLVEINHSKDLRSGGAMRGNYLKSLEELGGPPTQPLPVTDPDCPLHYDHWWGLFAAAPGHRQGSVPVDERLLAYLRLRRNGTYALYGQLLGHGSHLREGVVYALHMAVLQWLLAGEHPATAGLDHLFYGPWQSGGAGLQRWKRRLLFTPAYLVLPVAEA